MKVFKDKESGRYRVRFQTEHGARTITTKTGNRELAEQIIREAGLAEIESAARAGKLAAHAVAKIISGRRVTCLSAFDQWTEWMRSANYSERTIDNYRTLLYPFFKKHASASPSEITEASINDWINDQSRVDQRTSRLVQLTALRSFFNYCSAKGWAIGNPAKLVGINMNLLSHAQKESRVRVPFTESEVATLLSITPLGSFWHTAVAIGRYCGLRLGDIARLEWDCLASPGTIACWTDKRNARVELPVSAQPLIDALSALRRERNTRWLFPDKAEIAGDINRRANLSVEFGRLCAAIGIAGKSFHCLRHTYATEQANSGVPLWYVSKSLGHANIHTTQGYVH